VRPTDIIWRSPETETFNDQPKEEQAIGRVCLKLVTHGAEYCLFIFMPNGVCHTNVQSVPVEFISILKGKKGGSLEISQLCILTIRQNLKKKSQRPIQHLAQAGMCWTVPCSPTLTSNPCPSLCTQGHTPKGTATVLVRDGT
jgi:hypothetical protein